MTQINNLSKKADILADNLEELGVDVIDVETAIGKQALRVIAEADSDQARDATLRHITSAYQYGVHTFGDETIRRVEMEIRPPSSDRAVEFSVKREWLPADRDDADGWDEMIERINGTHRVIEQ